MAPKRIHFPMTTAAQRRLLFETWAATGDVDRACRTAHVGRANELAKANGWVPIVSPNTVRRILRDAGVWDQPAARAKTGALRPSAGPLTPLGRP